MTDTGADGRAPLTGPVGERLRAAREGQRLSLTEVAARTRIPLRHLEAIESGDYGALPSSTYAVGFAKAYARAVGVDEAWVGREVRERDGAAFTRREYAAYEIVDPARVPTRGLALAGIVLAVLLAVGAALWFGGTFDRPEDGAPVVAAVDAPTAPAATRAPAAASVSAGAVRLTAARELWLRVYDGSDKTLFTGTLAAGQSFDIPPGTDRPMINIGRPDQLQVTVDGKPVAALGDGSRPIKDVAVSAAALAARAGPALPPVTAPAPSAGAPASDSGALNIGSPVATPAP